MEDKRGIKRNERCPRADLSESALSGIDPAHSDQGEGTLGPHVGLRHDAGGEREKRRAREPAGLLCQPALAQHRRTRHRGIPDDHAVNTVPARGSDDIVKLGKREIRRNLDEHGGDARGTTHARARVHHACEQRIQHAALLQLAQTGRVR